MAANWSSDEIAISSPRSRSSPTAIASTWLSSFIRSLASACGSITPTLMRRTLPGFDTVCSTTRLFWYSTSDVVAAGRLLATGAGAAAGWSAPVAAWTIATAFGPVACVLVRLRTIARAALPLPVLPRAYGITSSRVVRTWSRSSVTSTLTIALPGPKVLSSTATTLRAR